MASFKSKVEAGVTQIFRTFKNMKEYKLNRTVFKAHTVQEAGDHARYYKNKSWKERLEIAAYLNSIAFNHPINDPPRMEKTIFKAKKRNG